MKPYYNRNIKFVRIACKKCGFDQILFVRSTTRIKCFECGEVLAMPKGGKCKLVGATIKEKLE